MNEVLPQLVESSGLAALAAATEVHEEFWGDQFTRLLATGFVRVPTVPGSELAMQLQPILAGISIEAVVNTLLRQLRPALRAGCRVCVDLSVLTGQAAATEAKLILAEFEQHLAKGIGTLVMVPEQISFSVRADQPGLEAFLCLRQSTLLGRPRLAVRFAGTAEFSAQPGWPALVAASHDDCGIVPVPAMNARLLSGLHATEQGQCVMPAGLFEVPPETGWLVLEIDARRIGPPQGLRARIACCLRFADNLIDSIDWHRSSFKLDAILNRRVAIHITGIGDMLLQAERDPAKATSFVGLHRWLMFVRRCFIHESVRLARHRGPFPELGVQELIDTLSPHYGVRNACRLVSNRSLRHRHLLALSPFSVFPAQDPVADYGRWLNLVPAIACADTLCMYGRDPRGHLSLKSWARLLQMTGALSANTAICAQSYTI